HRPGDGVPLLLLVRRDLERRLERDDALLDGLGLAAGGGGGGRRLGLGGLSHHRTGDQRGAEQRRNGQGPQDRLGQAKVGHGVSFRNSNFEGALDLRGSRGGAGVNVTAAERYRRNRR